VLQASRSLPKQRRSNPPPALTAAIFDVDGVLLASPHERAWREALQGFADPENFTSTMYQAHVAGKPRLIGVNRIPIMTPFNVSHDSKISRLCV
jgi:hypothetical protein